MNDYEEQVKRDKTAFFINKQIIVIKTITEFNLAKVRYVNCKKTFIIDINSISEKADLTNTISIQVLGGV